jgi:hypothetical protein
MNERAQPQPSGSIHPRLSPEEQILDVTAVMRLLGLHDARAARRAMREAGAFRVGRAYRLRATRLAAWIALQEGAEWDATASHERRGASSDAWISEIERLAR